VQHLTSISKKIQKSKSVSTQRNCTSLIKKQNLLSATNIRLHSKRTWEIPKSFFVYTDYIRLSVLNNKSSAYNIVLNISIINCYICLSRQTFRHYTFSVPHKCTQVLQLLLLAEPQLPSEQLHPFHPKVPQCRLKIYLQP